MMSLDARTTPDAAAALMNSLRVVAIFPLIGAAKATPYVNSDRGRNGRHVKVFEPRRWNEGGVAAVVRLTHVHRNRFADQRHVVVAHERRHVPAEVLDRPGDFAVLDEEQAIARHT